MSHVFISPRREYIIIEFNNSATCPCSIRCNILLLFVAFVHFINNCQLVHVAILVNIIYTVVVVFYYEHILHLFLELSDKWDGVKFLL